MERRHPSGSGFLWPGDFPARFRYDSAMPDRFFADDDFSQSTVELNRTESHHLLHVMRLGKGRQVTLFNGRGREATAEVEETGRQTVRLRISEVRTLPEPGGCALTLAVPPPKGERFRWLVEKAVELGVRHFIPLQTARSTVLPGSGRMEKARQWIIEAAKQCGASWLMQFSPPRKWGDFWKDHEEQRAGTETAPVLMAHPEGCLPAEIPAEVVKAPRLTLLVGPEGGWTAEELAEAHGKVLMVSLGSHTLRMETAAVALTAYLRLSGLSEHSVG